MSNSLYQQELMEHFRHSPHRGVLEKPDYVADDDNPSCGDRVTISFNVSDGRIVEMKFSGAGCVISQASASMLAEHLIGEPVGTLEAMTKQDFISLLRIPLGPARVRCATLSLSVAQAAKNNGKKE